MGSTKVITGKVKFSYANVWEPKAINEGDTPKYSVSILIPKTDTATIKKIERAIETAKQEGKAKWGGKIPTNLKMPLRDGDEDRPDDENYVGHYFINANSTSAPGIVDAAVNKIMDRDEFYSGCYGKASINFYAFAVSGNKGIAAGLNNLQKTHEGTPLSGGSSASEDFGVEDDDEI